PGPGLEPAHRHRARGDRADCVGRADPGRGGHGAGLHQGHLCRPAVPSTVDRKSTRLNSSHVSNSYAVFCLKKKKPIHWENSVPANWMIVTVSMMTGTV